MTVEQRAKTKAALLRYGAKLRGRDRKDAEAWNGAIEQALCYYDARDPLRAQMIRMRYFEHCTEMETMDRLNIGRTTYQKAQLDLLSTVAVYAAQRGAAF